MKIQMKTVFVIKDSKSDFPLSVCLDEGTAKETVGTLNSIDSSHQYNYTEVPIHFEDGMEVMEGNNANTVLCAVIESTTGYSCPNCGAICSEKTMVSKTETIFEELPDPHYSWEETHKCQKCETLYLLHNGT